MLTTYLGEVASPGLRFSPADPMLAYIEARQCYDATNGCVEAPCGWFGRAGRRIVRIDNEGNVTGEKFRSRLQARARYMSLLAQYSDWLIVSDQEIADSYQDIDPFVGP